MFRIKLVGIWLNPTGNAIYRDRDRILIVQKGDDGCNKLISSVFLILQLRYQHGLSTPDLRQTLPNLKNFLEHGLLVRCLDNVSRAGARDVNYRRIKICIRAAAGVPLREKEGDGNHRESMGRNGNGGSTAQSPVEQAQSDYLTSLTDPFTIHLLFPIQTPIVSEIQSSLPSSAAIISLMRSGGFQLEQEQSEMPSGEEDQNYERKSHSLEQWMEYKKKPRAKMVKGRRGVQDMVPLC
ncbi:UV radiation resistance-associated gene protein [Anabarilius grahami]|uniref:UV radiation resistance-associated gene protein n=1 Tax=Anabarilius grahami TaxID=495550 RepID=A0A3N0Z757_ANAGA|nr:UV radiation resistance-associated gene protein [Anabarilius grahami]